MIKFITLLLVCSLISSGNISAGKIKAALYATDNYHLDPKLICAIRDRAKEMYGIKIVFKGRLKFPEKADNGYKAEAFTRKLNRKRGNQEFAIGLTEQDIIRYHIWDWDFTFTVDTILGYTDIPGGSCIISYARLQDSLTLSRTVNVVMHEMGHLVGLDHCDDENCLMIAYDHLDNSSLCPICKKKLQKIKP